MADRHMIIAVSGSRTITDRAKVFEILDYEAIQYLSSGFTIEFRLGDAHGVDWLAREWARERAMVRTIVFADRKQWEFWAKAAQLRDFVDPGAEMGVLVSDWDRDGDSAGPIRNHAIIGGAKEDVDDRKLVKPMGKADLLIAIWDGSSRGTRNAMVTARNYGVFIHQWGGDGAIAFRNPGVDERPSVEFRGTIG
jgi:hypothetical protein